jgi:hypothetical protein
VYLVRVSKSVIPSVADELREIGCYPFFALSHSFLSSRVIDQLFDLRTEFLTVQEPVALPRESLDELVFADPRLSIHEQSVDQLRVNDAVQLLASHVLRREL